MALTKTPIELSSTPGIVDDSNNTAITINSSEYVGIGIGLPASLLDVASTGEVTSTVRSTSASGVRQATLRLNVFSTGGDDPAGRVQFTYGMGYTVAGSIEMTHTLNNMKFLTGTTERMRIDSSGNALVGRTARLTGQSESISSDTVVSVHGVLAQHQTNAGILQYNGNVFSLRAYGASAGTGTIAFNTGGGGGGADEERMRITSAGKLIVNGTIAGYSGTGITIGSPSAGSSGLSILSTTTGYGYLLFGDTTGDATGGYSGQINYAHGTNRMGINTNGGERMAIDSSGNVLVGKINTGDYVAGIEMQPAGAILSYRTSGVASIFGRTDSGEITRFTRGGAIIGSVDVDATGYIAINARTGTGRLQVGGVTRYNWDANQFYPQQDNVRDLGYPNLRWDDVYSTGGINTSDRNEKQDIEELSNAEQRVAVACKGLMRKFRWKSAVIDKGDDARIHVGIMAQDLQAAFESEGLDPARYGMWCSNTWTDEETGEEITRMSVRYNELLAFIISAI